MSAGRTLIQTLCHMKGNHNDNTSTQHTNPAIAPITLGASIVALAGVGLSAYGI